MKSFGLIGFPLGHSFSKKYFDNKFLKESIPGCTFELFSMENLSGFINLKESNSMLSGLAVTIPFKEQIIPYLDSLHDVASTVGAVNCIKINQGKYIGYNTDVIGFELSFVPLRKTHHNKALILGSGGVSKAVQYVFKKIGVEYTIVGRKESPQENIISYSIIDASMMQSHQVIINCTPIGSYPLQEEKPLLPYEHIGKQHLLFDMGYNPDNSLFLQEGEKVGAVTKNGLDMLMIQAEENWKIWNS